jgi:hypothetical protein
VTTCDSPLLPLPSPPPTSLPLTNHCFPPPIHGSINIYIEQTEPQTRWRPVAFTVAQRGKIVSVISCCDAGAHCGAEPLRSFSDEIAERLRSSTNSKRSSRGGALATILSGCAVPDSGSSSGAVEEERQRGEFWTDCQVQLLLAAIMYMYIDGLSVEAEVSCSRK